MSIVVGWSNGGVDDNWSLGLLVAVTLVRRWSGQTTVGLTGRDGPARDTLGRGHTSIDGSGSTLTELTGRRRETSVTGDNQLSGLALDADRDGDGLLRGSAAVALGGDDLGLRARLGSGDSDFVPLVFQGNVVRDDR